MSADSDVAARPVDDHPGEGVDDEGRIGKTSPPEADVDEVGSSGCDSWCVLVRGLAEEVTDASQRAELDPLVPKPWPFSAGLTTWSGSLQRLSPAGAFGQPSQP